MIDVLKGVHKAELIKCRSCQHMMTDLTFGKGLAGNYLCRHCGEHYYKGIWHTRIYRINTWG